MNRAPRWLIALVALVSAVAVASVAMARGGGRGGGRIAAPGTLCLSADLFSLSLTRTDILVKTSGQQKAAFDELKKAAKEFSDNMSRVCADNPTDIPARVAASEKRLEALLAGVRKMRPLAERFTRRSTTSRRARPTTSLIGRGSDHQRQYRTR